MKFNERLNRWEGYYGILNKNWPELYAWCWMIFGHPGTNPETGIKSGWDYHAGYIYIYDEKLVTTFMLRWS